MKKPLIDVGAAEQLFMSAASIIAWSERDPDRYSDQLVKQAHKAMGTVREIVPRLRLWHLEPDLDRCEWVIRFDREERARYGSMRQAVAGLTALIHECLKNGQETKHENL